MCAYVLVCELLYDTQMMRFGAGPEYISDGFSELQSQLDANYRLWEDFGTSSGKPDYESGRDEKFRIDQTRIKINIQNPYYVVLCPATL